MSTYELLDIMFSLSHRVDTHWALFITVHLALIGGIIYVDRPLSTKEKIAAGTVYTGFAVINYVVMKGQLDLLASIYQQLVSMANDPCCVDNYVISHVVDLEMSGLIRRSQLIIILVHLVMYVVVILSLFYDTSVMKNAQNN